MPVPSQGHCGFHSFPVVMFSVVCQETKSKQFIVTVRASIAKVKLELTCSAFNDYLTSLFIINDITHNLLKLIGYTALLIPQNVTDGLAHF
jgi:hypothetical protein